MIQRDAYKLVDLLPPFLKTYGYALGLLDHGRHLSDETAAEIEELETLTRDLNALQVVLGLPYIYTTTIFDSSVFLTAYSFYKRLLHTPAATLLFSAGKRRVVFECAR